MTRRKETLPDSGLLYVPAGEYDGLRPPFDFLPDHLYDNSVVMLYGPPGSGKTFFAIRLLCSTALGLPLFGLTPEKRRCLYVGLEGEAGIKARIAACCAELGVDSSPIDYALGCFSLADETDVEALIDQVNRRKIGVVVIDTLSLAIAGVDEISGQSMTQVMNILHRIKRETGACVVAIGHTGKDIRAGQRGHSSQLGNADTGIEIVEHNVERVHDGKKAREIEHPVTLATPRSAVVRKQRDGEGGKRLHFTLALHDTPFRNARGNWLKCPAVCEHEAFADLPEEEDTTRPPRIDAVALEVLEVLQRRNQRLGLTTTRKSYRAGLKRAGWKQNSKSVDAWDRAFRRLMQRLEEAELWGATIQ